MDKESISPEQLKKLLIENEFEKKEAPEKMIRSLQGVFCKGRYCSWVSAQEFLSSQDAKRKRKLAAKNKHGGQNGNKVK